MSELSKEDFVDQIEQNQGILHKVCSLFCQSTHDREDLYQEIILQLWKSWPKFKGNSKLSTWMYRVALNTAIGMSARNKKHKVGEHQTQIPEPSFDNQEEREREEQIQLLYSCISRLSEIERAVILLYLEEKPYEEIAEITGLSKTNVGVRVLRIKKKLESEINKGISHEG